MNRWIGILVFGVFLSPGRLWADLGHEVGSNGDRVSTWINGLGYQILDELKRREALGTPLDPKVKTSEFERALDTPIILVDKNNEAELTNKYGEVKDVKYVALKDGSGNALLFHRQTWTDLYDQKRPDYQTVAHGYFYACGLDDKRNYFSSKLVLNPSTVAPISVFKRKYALDAVIPTRDGGYLAVESWDRVRRLDSSAIRTWEVTNPRTIVPRTIISLLETGDGGSLAMGRTDWPRIPDGPEKRPFITKLDAEGKTIWQLDDFCVREDRDPKLTQCSGDGIVQAIESGKGDLLLLLNETHNRRISSYVAKLSSDGHTIRASSGYWDNARLLTFRKTSDGGYVFFGWQDAGDWPSKNPENDHFYVKKTDALFRTEWEQTLFAGRAWNGIVLSTGGYLAVGSKVLGSTGFPDLKTEPVMVKIGPAGNIEDERSLYFADTNEDDPKRMGRSGEAKSVAEDAEGTIWISGSNNLFAREDRQFYFAEDGSYQLVEKNGFVYTIPKQGDPHFRIFPGTSRLDLQLTPDAKLLLTADRWFSKIWSHDL